MSAASTHPPRPAWLDQPGTVRIIKRMSDLNVRLFRATGGRLGSRWRVGAAFPRGVPVCLLTHQGRKSHQLYTAPLLYITEGEKVIVVASQGGLPTHPQWYRNIRANPRVTVQMPRGSARRMIARTATADERARLWPKLVDHYADFAQYQRWTDREIPVVICEPAPGA